MPYEIVMPQLGLTMTEGSVNAWVKQPGERVEKGEMLFTVSTDKVEMEVESTGSGFLNTIVGLGQTVPVGTVIAVLTDHPGEKPAGIATTIKDGKAAATARAQEPSGALNSDDTNARGGTTNTCTPQGRSFPASPRARHLARSLGIEIAEVVPGSGTRIVEADVQRHYQEQKSVPQPEPISAARRITAERTAQSFERAPHFYLGRELNAGRMVQLRAELQGTAQRRLGFPITYTDFLLRALAMALREEKAVNAQWENGTLTERQSIDVAFAAQTEKALLTPVIRNADKLDFFAMAAQRKQLSERAREGKLQPGDLQGGSATLTNLGTHGVDWFQAILNPPQSVILACGSIAKRATVIDGSLAVADTLILCLSADHRVLDGVAAATFLGVIARLIEDPLEILV